LFSLEGFIPQRSVEHQQMCLFSNIILASGLENAGVFVLADENLQKEREMYVWIRM
jgi:hypothetical protein